MVRLLQLTLGVKRLISVYVNSFLSLLLRAQISPPYKRMETASALYTFIHEHFWTKPGLKVLFTIPNIGGKILLVLLNIFLNLITKFRNRNFVFVINLTASYSRNAIVSVLVIFSYQNLWVARGSEMRAITSPTQTPNLTCS